MDVSAFMAAKCRAVHLSCGFARFGEVPSSSKMRTISSFSLHAARLSKSCPESDVASAPAFSNTRRVSVSPGLT